jgi:hypothetical protein
MKRTLSKRRGGYKKKKSIRRRRIIMGGGDSKFLTALNVLRANNPNENDSTHHIFQALLTIDSPTDPKVKKAKQCFKSLYDQIFKKEMSRLRTPFLYSDNNSAHKPYTHQIDNWRFAKIMALYIEKFPESSTFFPDSHFIAFYDNFKDIKIEQGTNLEESEPYKNLFPTAELRGSVFGVESAYPERDSTFQGPS